MGAKREQMTFGSCPMLPRSPNGMGNYLGATLKTFARKPSWSMAAASLSAEILLSSNSTRASAFSRLTSAFLTPGSLSKAVATETGQELQTIPFTSIVATFGAASATVAAASRPRSRSDAIARVIRRLIDASTARGPHMPARM